MEVVRLREEVKQNHRQTHQVNNLENPERVLPHFQVMFRQYKRGLYKISIRTKTFGDLD
jgi:hypothetical protein